MRITDIIRGTLLNKKIKKEDNPTILDDNNVSCAGRRQVDNNYNERQLSYTAKKLDTIKNGLSWFWSVQ